MFSAMKINNHTQYISKAKFDNFMNLLLISGEKDVFQFGQPTAEDWVTKSVVNQMVDVNGRHSFFKGTQVKHYCLISVFTKFMYHQTKYKARKNFCMYCLQCFSSEKVLADHKNNCLQINGEQAIKMPEK